MEYLPVGDDLHLDALKISHAAVVYQAIDKNRNYLRRWLSFCGPDPPEGRYRNLHQDAPL